MSSVYFRVTCHSGAAIIVGVAYQSKTVSVPKKVENIDDETVTKSEDKIDQIKATINSFEKQKAVLREKAVLLEKERKLLEDFSACLLGVSLLV